METSSENLLGIGMSQTIKIRVQRYRPELNDQPFTHEYDIPYSPDMVVLDALNYIKDHIDGSLTYRWSCRMGVCGSCGANVNGTPKLTCETFLKDLKGGVVDVQPLGNFPVIKDLAVELAEFMKKLKEISPWIIRKEEKPIQEGEFRQTEDQLDLYRQTSMCINCMLCYAACPVYAVDYNFLGPAAAALAFRYINDSRDQGISKRLHAINHHERGMWDCTFVGECSVVCPKAVGPALAIQQLKAISAIELTKSILMPRIKE